MKALFKSVFFLLVLFGLNNLGAQTLFSPDGQIGTTLSGNESVGIGTSNPAVHSKLDVAGAIATNGQKIIDSESDKIKIGDLDGDDGLSTLELWSNNQSRLSIDANGNIGIGGNSDGATLDVKGDESWGVFSGFSGRGLLSNNPGWGTFELPTIGSTGGQSSIIALHNPLVSYRNDLAWLGYPEGFAGVRMASDVDGVVFWQTGVTEDNYVLARNIGGTSEEILRINNIGNVGIGTNTIAGYKLAVLGKAIVTDIEAVPAGNAPWPDYVFEKDYNLMSLEKTEEYISKEGHLPGFQSAEDIKSEGKYSMAEMDAKLLEKIEELTLHMIALKKENEALKSQMKSLAK